jgi:hypothetical protein
VTKNNHFALFGGFFQAGVVFASNSGVYKGKNPHIAFGGVWSFEFYFSLGRAKALIRMIVAIEVRNKGVVVSRKEVLALGSTTYEEENQ